METKPPDSSSVPQLAFEMALISSKLEVSTTQPCRIHFTIRRLPDSQDASCIISWKDFSEIFYGGSLELYHVTAQGSKKVDTGPAKSLPPDPLEQLSDQIHVTAESRARLGLHEIRPGSSITFRHTLLDSYHRCLISGQKYRLRWSGRCIKHWTWASFSDGNAIDFRKQDLLPNLYLPATDGFAFSVVEENERWPDRTRIEERFGFVVANTMEWEWRRNQGALQARRERIRLEDSNQLAKLESGAGHPENIDKNQEEGPVDPDLPTLGATLKAASTFSTDKPFTVTLHIKYEEASRKLEPITFHTYRIDDRFDLFRQENTQGHDIWEPCPMNETMGFMIVDDPDVRVNVAEHEGFVSLRQGETYTKEYNLHHPSGGFFPGDTAVGDLFRIRWTGTELDWWDWGTSQDHRDTEALLPCFISADVIKSNKGMGNRKLDIRKAQDIYATVVES